MTAALKPDYISLLPPRMCSGTGLYPLPSLAPVVGDESAGLQSVGHPEYFRSKERASKPPYGTSRLFS
jgi:hypothetical protein